LFSGVVLQLTDLSLADWEAFEGQVKRLAEQQEVQTGKFEVGGSSCRTVPAVLLQ
jgi:hypothetical protein